MLYVQREIHYMIQLYEVDSSKKLTNLLASNPDQSFVFF